MPVEEIDGHEIRDVGIEEICPNVVDNVLVTVIDGHHTLFLPYNFMGIQFKNWKKGRGGRFSRDVLCHSLGKPCGKYVVIKDRDATCVARLIEEDEEEMFRSLKLVDGQIKDKHYMVLKNVGDDAGLTGTVKYRSERDWMQESIFVYYGPSQHKEIPDDDYDRHTGSVSLFND